MTDIDGNVYNTVKIGTQVWMKQNLIVTKFNDGTPINNTTDNTAWLSTTDPAYCAFDNDETNAFDIITPLPSTSGLAYLEKGGIQDPDWRIALNADLQNLIDTLGGVLVAGGKLKEADLSKWVSPNTGATDLVGYKAVPGGYRDIDGNFHALGQECRIWSGDGLIGGNYVHFLKLLYNSAQAAITDSPNSTDQRNGFSVRLVKDLSTDEDMKYSQTINLVAGDITTVTTTLTVTQVPYSYLIEDSSGNPIGGESDIQNKQLIGGVWVLQIYSSSAISGATLKIIY
jgi:uncharacterized protein (TIGR02145 family)